MRIRADGAEDEAGLSNQLSLDAFKSACIRVIRGKNGSPMTDTYTDAHAEALDATAPLSNGSGCRSSILRDMFSATDQRRSTRMEQKMRATSPTGFRLIRVNPCHPWQKSSSMTDPYTDAHTEVLDATATRSNGSGCRCPVSRDMIFLPRINADPRGWSRRWQKRLQTTFARSV